LPKLSGEVHGRLKDRDKYENDFKMFFIDIGFEDVELFKMPEDLSDRFY
jgi:hypothetical protein